MAATKIIKVDEEVMRQLRKMQARLQARADANITLNDAIRFCLWPDHPKGSRKLDDRFRREQRT